MNSSEQEQKQVFSYLSKQSEHRGRSFLRDMIVMVLGNTFSSGNLVLRAADQKRHTHWRWVSAGSNFCEIRLQKAPRTQRAKRKWKTTRKMTGKTMEKKRGRLDEVWCRRKQNRHVAECEKKPYAWSSFLEAPKAGKFQP